MMRIGLTVGLLFTAGAHAFAQDQTPIAEGDLAIDLDVRFISTYRDGSWVPIDILVNNNKSDIDGYVEVATIVNGQRHAPVYRVPAVSPKGSRKRFRTYCLLDGATEISAMLYDGNRPALSLPMEITLRPISSDDYLCLVLDDQPADFGFLYNALLDPQSEQGLYRVELRGDELNALPDKLACYEPIDFIILGDVNPEDISRRHRALLDRYVAGGGTVIVCAGANAQQYRGTWIEEFTGVGMGSQEIVNEVQFAARVLPNEPAGRLEASKQGEFTVLEPLADGLVRWGGAEPLAVLRPIGDGFAGVVAHDMASKLLHGNAAYQRMWAQLARLNLSQPDINFDAANGLIRDRLPHVAGVRVFPKSSVAAFLTLYLLVAIVGNWVFWSSLKRREMAWVTLVVLSAGFTGYAMIFGTAGRAKESEIEQIEIVRVYDYTPLAKVHSTVGLLSARSSRYDFELTDDSALVSQGVFTYSPYGGTQMTTGGDFAFVEDTPPRVADLRVGAGVIRSFVVERDIRLPGGIDGTLIHDDNGLHGELINNTGLRLEEPFILYRGMQVPVLQRPGSKEIRVKRSAERLNSVHSGAANMNDYIYYGYYQQGVQSVENAIKQPLPMMAFLSADRMSEFDPSLGPFLCGWTTDDLPEPTAIDPEVKRNIRETFVVADVQVAGDQRRPTHRTLTIETDGSVNNLFSGPFYRDWNNLATRLRWDRGINTGRGGRAQNVMPITIDVPHEIELAARGPLTLDLEWMSEQGNVVAVVFEDAPEGSKPEPAKGTRESLGMTVNYSRYVLENWRDYYDAPEGVIRMQVALVPESGQRASTWGNFILRASLDVAPDQQLPEEWTPWP